jgi:hypothetical protein
MSGAGRKHRAKHLTRQYLDVSGWVGPKEGETLAVCLESPHGQHVRVLLLFAHPRDVPALTKDAVVNGTKLVTAPPTGDSGSGGSANPVPLSDGAEAATALDKEQLVFLPGKFHKVIWLSIKDIVVVSDGTVTFKPSPEQLENFMKDPTHAGWRERIVAAQQKAEEQRAAVQRMPQYSTTVQTTTSVLTGPQVHRGARKVGEAVEGEAGEEVEAEEEVDDLVNPNWRNIKHHQQFFYGVDDDSEEGEEEDEEETEGERK